MAETLLNGKVKGFEVSTIRTDAGGATKSYGAFGLFSSADFDDLNLWPFETMVFKVGSRVGLYHEPYATEKEAQEGHGRIVKAIDLGVLEWGRGVQGPSGVPSLTAEEWAARSNPVG